MANLSWLVKLIVTEGIALAREAFGARRAKAPHDLDIVSAGIAMSSGAAASREGKLAKGLGIMKAEQDAKEAEIRQRIVDFAIAEVGETFPDKYWRVVLPGDPGPYPKSWCGAGYLWCLHQAGVTDAKWRRGTGIEGAFRMANIPVEYTREPLPGDMAYFDKNQHHAVVIAPTGGMVGLVNFNGDGGKVTRNHKTQRAVKLFYSIASLVRQAATAELAAEKASVA